MSKICPVISTQVPETDFESGGFYTKECLKDECQLWVKKGGNLSCGLIVK